jgi:hypothetical protein
LAAILVTLSYQIIASDGRILLNHSTLLAWLAAPREPWSTPRAAIDALGAVISVSSARTACPRRSVVYQSNLAVERHFLLIKDTPD